MLMQEIKAIEAQFPQLITADSPTQTVQGIANSTFEGGGYKQLTHSDILNILKECF